MEAPDLPLLRRLRPGHWVAIDCVAAAGFAMVYALLWRELAFLQGPRPSAAAVVAVAVLPAALRRRWLRTALGLAVAGQVIATLLARTSEPAIAVAFVSYLIPLRYPRREAVWLLAGALAATTAAFAAHAALPIPGPAFGAGPAALLSALLITAGWLIGNSVRRHRVYTAALNEQAERRAREEVTEARRVISEQRLQIARELHDVVAHTMSVIAVQAGVAHFVIGEHPDEATRALASIQGTSRGALTEMRALLSVLRADGPELESALSPTPGLADLDVLLSRAADAGMRVDLDVVGEPPALAAGVDLAAYRVIQEAVTNVIKHAAIDRCRVTIDYRGDALTVEVTDAGRGSGTVPEGHGIVGMRERVAMYGGELQVEPLAGRGFQVTARFPLTGTAA